MMLLLKALVMGVVEGVTEFLPISSTGHLIIAGSLMDFWAKDKREVFEISIQLAAILAVCWEYRARLLAVCRGLLSDRNSQSFVLNLLIAFLPAALVGVIAIKTIKHYLFNPVAVAIALVVGGFLILWVEKREHRIRIQEVDEMSLLDAFKIGCMQCLALIPGTSRSGATIIGGLFFGLSRKAATEFSFFLAIPTMFAATLYDTYKNRSLFSFDDVDVFAVGFVASFVSAFVAVRALLRFIQRHDFSLFAWYRIVFGLALLITTYAGWVTWE
ncbi:MAG TPA: undecaprenyl-diphosphate phosphatase [Pseudomonadales bacterium]|nr:undecaprenyl-diphosphate phosphatase [Pseudomonadales bacterium]